MIDVLNLDCDGVIFDWRQALRREVVRQLDRKKSDCPTQTDQYLPPWMTKDDWLWYSEHIYEVFAFGRCYPGAKAGIKKLRTQAIEFNLISHVPEGRGRQGRMDWLEERRLAEIFDNIYLLDLDEKKSTFDATLYIDDSPFVYEELTGLGKNVLLVDRSWNRNMKATYREKDWAGIVSFVDHHSFQNTFRGSTDGEPIRQEQWLTMPFLDAQRNGNEATK